MSSPREYLRLFVPLFATYALMMLAAVLILAAHGVAISAASIDRWLKIAVVGGGLVAIGLMTRSGVAMLGALTVAAFLGMLPSLSVMSYALTALGKPFPLQDDLLARIDALFGFDWPATVAILNRSPELIRILDASYTYTIFGMMYALVFANVTKRVDRVLEFFWGTALTCVIMGMVAALLPAIGAYPYYGPSQDIRSAISADSGIWHLQHFNALRDGTFSVYDMNTTEGLVTFPSFHTAVALLIPLTLRGYGAVTAVAWAFAATVIVSTIPIGGHHLVDVVAGAAITVATVALLARVRWTRALTQTPGSMAGADTSASA